MCGNGLGIGLAVDMAGPALQGLMWALGDANKPEVVAGLMQSAMPGVAVAMIASAIAGSVVTTAICRAVAGDENDRLGFLQFGTAELRLIFINLIILVLPIPIVMACLLVVLLLPGALPAPPGVVRCLPLPCAVEAVLPPARVRVRVCITHPAPAPTAATPHEGPSSSPARCVCEAASVPGANNSTASYPSSAA